MHRKASASGSSPLSDPPAIYEKREIDPNAEETVRRLGSARQAQYAQALGLVSGPKGSFIAYDTELNLGSTWSVGFSLNVGDVAEDTGEWTVLFGGSTATTDLANSFRVYLKRNGADYQVNLRRHRQRRHRVGHADHGHPRVQRKHPGHKVRHRRSAQCGWVAVHNDPGWYLRADD
jgi:hypothetical protein